MELCEEERYAAAALFTMALHSTQVDSGAGRRSFREKVPGGWGEPTPQALDRFLEGRVAHPELDGPAWDAFWGWDCCGPDGLLDRVYQQLELPERTWAGLKKLPEVAYGDGFDEFMDLVKTYMAVLDTSLPMPPKRKKKRRKSRLPLVPPGTQSIDAMLFGQQGSSQPSSRGGSRRGTNSGEGSIKFTGGASGHLIIRGATDGAGEAFQPAQPVHKELAEEEEEDDEFGNERARAAAGKQQVGEDADGAAAQREVRDDLFDDCMDSGGDSDLEDDLKRAQLASEFAAQASMASFDSLSLAGDGGPDSRPLTPGGSVAGLASAASGAAGRGGGAGVRVSLFVKRLDDGLGGSSELVSVRLEAVEGGGGGGLASTCWSPTTSVCSELPDAKSLRPGPPPRPEPSQKALAAMWELLEGCLALAHPELEKEMQQRKLAQLEARLEEAEALHKQQQQQQQGEQQGKQPEAANGSSNGDAAGPSSSASALAGAGGFGSDGRPSSSGGARPLIAAPSADEGVLQRQAADAADAGAAAPQSPRSPLAAANGLLSARYSQHEEQEAAALRRQQQQSPRDLISLDSDAGAQAAAAAAGGGVGSPGDDGTAGLLRPSALRSDAPEQQQQASTSGGSGDKGAAAAAAAEEEAKHPEEVQPLMPRVRWYDARARIAVKRLAQWLNVPWSRVSNFEMLLGYQLQTGERQRPMLEVDNWTKGKRWAKVGTIALAGGGAFALVGGLVMAPLLVAALPWFAATAGASAFFASAGGVATMTSTMGVLGFMDAGARAKRRTQYDVHEFGFMEVRYVPPRRRALDSVSEEDGKSKEGAKVAVGGEQQQQQQDGSDAASVSSKGAAVAANGDDAAAAAAFNGTSDAASLSASSSSAAITADGTAAGVAGAAAAAAAAAGTAAAAAAAAVAAGGADAEVDEAPSTSAAASLDAGHLDPGHIALGAGPGRPVRPRAANGAAAAAAAGGPGASDTARLLGAGAVSSSSGSPGPSPEPAKAPSRRWFGFGSYSSLNSSAKSDGAGDAGGSGRGEGSEAASPENGKQLTPRERRKATKQSARQQEEAEKQWWKMLKKEELLTFPMKKSRADARGAPATMDSNMSIVIAVNGWIRKREDFLTQWATLHAPDADVFTLIWESKELIALNYALGSFFLTQVAQQTAQTAASKLLLGPLVAAVAPAIMLNTASGVLIDNAWAVMVERSIKAGKLLAHTLMTGGHGDRPVVLVGYSMGARLVFHCLLELCRHNCKGIVEHAVMLGMPVSVRPERWRMARSVVAGRFVNGYSRNDWVLQVVYRTSKGFIQAAGGLGPVNLPGVENVNLTGLIDGHFSYMKHIDEVMDLINLWPQDQK